MKTSLQSIGHWRSGGDNCVSMFFSISSKRFSNATTILWPGVRESRHLQVGQAHTGKREYLHCKKSFLTSPLNTGRCQGPRSFLHHPLSWCLSEDWHEDSHIRCAPTRGQQMQFRWLTSILFYWKSKPQISPRFSIYFIILFITKLGQSKTKLSVLKIERVINGINRKEKMHFNNSSDHFDGLFWQEFLSCPPFYIFHRMVSSINLSNPNSPKRRFQVPVYLAQNTWFIRHS